MSPVFPTSPDPRPASWSHILHTGAGVSPYLSCQGLWSPEQARKEGRKGVGVSEPLSPSTAPSSSFASFPPPPTLIPALSAWDLSPHLSHPKCGSPLVQEWVHHVITWPQHMAPSEYGHVTAGMEGLCSRATGVTSPRGPSLLVFGGMWQHRAGLYG